MIVSDIISQFRVLSVNFLFSDLNFSLEVDPSDLSPKDPPRQVFRVSGGVQSGGVNPAGHQSRSQASSQVTSYSPSLTTLQTSLQDVDPIPDLHDQSRRGASEVRPSKTASPAQPLSAGWLAEAAGEAGRGRVSVLDP